MTWMLHVIVPVSVNYLTVQALPYLIIRVSIEVLVFFLHIRLEAFLRCTSTVVPKLEPTAFLYFMGFVIEVLKYLCVKPPSGKTGKLHWP